MNLKAHRGQALASFPFERWDLWGKSDEERATSHWKKTEKRRNLQHLLTSYGLLSVAGYSCSGINFNNSYISCCCRCYKHHYFNNCLYKWLVISIAPIYSDAPAINLNQLVCIEEETVCPFNITFRFNALWSSCPIQCEKLQKCLCQSVCLCLCVSWYVHVCLCARVCMCVCLCACVNVSLLSHLLSAAYKLKTALYTCPWEYQLRVTG